MHCPLPIDWLDHLEGASSDALNLHLEKCQACRRLVADLKQSAGNSSLLRFRATEANSRPRLSEQASPALAMGDVRWSSFTSEEGQHSSRVLLLLLCDPWPEAGTTWVDVLPVTTDVESATFMDVVFDRKHSELNAPLRLHLNHQLVANASNVGGRWSRLTDEGVSLLREILEGNFEGARPGSWNDDLETEQSSLSSEMLGALKGMARDYARLQEGLEATEAAKVTYIPMVRRKPVTAVHEGLRLAAASRVDSRDYLWCAEIPSDGSVCGKIEYDFRNDQLIFVVVQMNAVYRKNVRVIVALVTDRFPQPISSEPFVLALDSRVIVGKDLAVLPPEIQGLELRVLNEA